MKKILIIILTIVLAGCVFVSCADDNGAQTITICLPDGATALAVAKLMRDFTYEDYTVNFEIVAGASDITAKISQGAADIAILPTNIATKMYSSNIDIKLISSNVYGVLYLVGTEQITSLNQLIDQTVYCIGQGGTPDFMLQFLLSQAGILDRVTINYQTDGSAIIPLLKTGVAKFALLGEPAATMSTQKAGATVMFNMQTEWYNYTGYEGYPQASTIATTNAITNHYGFLKAFCAAMAENASWVSANYAEVNTILAGKGSAVTFSSSTVIDNCNIKYVKASDARADIEKYLEVMQVYNSAFVGTIPGDAFYQDIE